MTGDTAGALVIFRPPAERGMMVSMIAAPTEGGRFLAKNAPHYCLKLNFKPCVPEIT